MLLFWCDLETTKSKLWEKKQNKTNNQTQKMKFLTAKPNILFFFYSEWRENYKDGKWKRSETADGKRQDEEDCEMGVWVVLSGGQGNSGGRICLC